MEDEPIKNVCRKIKKRLPVHRPLVILLGRGEKPAPLYRNSNRMVPQKKFLTTPTGVVI